MRQGQGDTDDHGSARTRKWSSLEWALTLMFLALYIWLRWWSGLWQNRWIGFALGALLAVFVVVSGRRPSNYFRLSGFYPPTYLFVPLSLVCFSVGIIGLARFLRGASGDEGLGGFIMLSLGVQQACIYRYLSNQDRCNLDEKDEQ